MAEMAEMELEEAIQRNRADVLRRLHQQGINILECQIINTCPFINAVENNSLDICRFYLETFPDFDQNLLYEAFSLILENDSAELYKLFLEFGIEASYYSVKNGDYAIHRAAASGSILCLKLLLDRGAADIINSRSKYLVKTPLTLATVNGQHEVVSFLLQQGADPELLDRQGCKAYQYGFCSCNAEKGYSVDHLSYGDSMLNILALYELDFSLGHILDDISSNAVYDNVAPKIPPIALFRVLLSAGYYRNINFQCSNVTDELIKLILFETASSFPCIQDIVYALLEETLMEKSYILKAIFDETYGYNSPHLKQLPTVLSCLATDNFSIVHPDILKHTFVSIVTSKQDYSFRVLPIFFENTNLIKVALDADHDTALILTLKFNHDAKKRLEVTKMLLEAGANVFMRNKEGHTAFSLVMETNFFDLAVQENQEYVEMITSATATSSERV